MCPQPENRVRVFMQCLAYGVGIVSMVALTVALFFTIRTTDRVIAQVPAQLTQTRSELVTQIQATRFDLDQQLNETRAQVLAAVNTQVGGLRADAKSELDAYRNVADARLGDALSRVDTTLAGVDPVLKNAAAITAHTDEATAILFRRDALPAQLLGVTGAAKVALGQTALTMRTIQAATPEITANVTKASAESAKASEQTAQVMGHLADATKPLPKWLRVVLAVAPPLAGTAAGVASVMAATGTIP